MGKTFFFKYPKLKNIPIDLCYNKIKSPLAERKGYQKATYKQKIRNVVTGQTQRLYQLLGVRAGPLRF